MRGFHYRSCGSFYNLNAKSGSLEANPPFTEELMELMVTHMEELLEGAGDNPISFTISTVTYSTAVY